MKSCEEDCEQSTGVWYALSWKGMGRNIRELARKNENPLGSGGALHPRFGGVAVSDELEQDHIDDDDEGGI